MDDSDVSLHTDGDSQVDAARQTNLGQRQQDRHQAGVPGLSADTERTLKFLSNYDEKLSNFVYFVLFLYHLTLHIRCTPKDEDLF